MVATLTVSLSPSFTMIVAADTAQAVTFSTLMRFQLVVITPAAVTTEDRRRILAQVS